MLPLLLVASMCVQAPAEATTRVPALANGDFRLPTMPRDDPIEPPRIAWWAAPPAVILETHANETWLVTPPATIARQPLPAYAPLAHELVVRGRVRGAGVATIVDGSGERLAFPVGDGGNSDGAAGDTSVPFEIRGDALAQRLGRALSPRFALELASASQNEPARWTAVEADVLLPAPSEAELRREVLLRLHECLDPWIERALDRVGPRETAFAVHVFDALDGTRITTAPGALHALYESLLRAYELVPEEARWTLALETYLEDFLTLGLHPETGLPRLWEPVLDAPKDEGSVEVAAYLRYLLDVVEHGPPAFRERAEKAASRIGATVLARGVLPDGNVASVYRARDGEASSSAPPLRRLDLPAQLARLGARTGDKRLATAARNAVAAFEYTHTWPGDWKQIDPGFDDYFGHYGARGVVLVQSDAAEPTYRRIVRGAFDRYAPMWRDAVRFGGSIAADEVRCWDLLAEYAALDAEVATALPALLADAMHAHLAGEQYPNGAWGDVTYFAYEPQIDLAVGDLPGLPANLIRGIAIAYEPRFGLRTTATRAWYAAVLRSTVVAYRREYGYLSRVRAIDGHNDAGGSLRLAPGLLRMLGEL